MTRSPLSHTFLVLILSIASFAATETVLYNFAGGTDGANPSSALLPGGATIFYGLTSSGGTHGFGTVYKLAKVGSTWTETVLYSFTGGADGGGPSGDLIRDSAGNLYGTTSGGGNLNFGVVFKLTRSSSGWIQSVLYSFTGAQDGEFPTGGVIRDSAGNLYGTTASSNQGVTGSTVFQLSPAAGSYTEHTLHTFSGPDGWNANPGLVLRAGKLYGTTRVGPFGFPSPNSFGFGLVYQLTNVSGVWIEKILYAFRGRVLNDAVYPYAGVIFDPHGNILGTTNSCPDAQCGTVFQLTPTAATWSEKILYKFSGPDGANPQAPVILDSAGNIYGTTRGGGMGGVNGNLRHGTAFQLTPTATGYTHTTLHSFTAADGKFPTTKPFRNSAGFLFGTAAGGTHNLGVIYQISPSSNPL